MVNLMRRDPFSEPMGRAVPTAMMNRLIDRFLNDPFLAEPSGGMSELGGLLEETSGTLALDIAEDDQNVIVRASLPGFDKDDIDIEVQNGVLSINAEHKEEHEEKDERFVRRERRFGSLMRRIALPSNVQDDHCEAELRNGVLTLRIPKSEEAKPRKIQVKSGDSGGEQVVTDRAQKQGDGQQDQSSRSGKSQEPDRGKRH